MSLTIQNQYKAITNNSEFNFIREYVTPAHYEDPRKSLLQRANADYKRKAHHKKFKATAKHKIFYLDQQIKPIVPNPSPAKYKTLTKDYFGDGDIPKFTIKRSKSANLTKKEQTKAIRGTYIDDIEKHQAKHKAPGIGKYDLTKDPWAKTFLNLKSKQKPIKFHKFDDIRFIASAIPGAGHYNPHKSVPKLRPNRTDYKFFKAKHADEQNSQKKKVQTKLSPFTYTPLVSNTFDSILRRKSLERSRWSHGDIDIRKGLRSEFKSPSPAEYKLLNQWSARKPQERESELGKVKLLERTTRSARSLSVYH